MATTASEAVPTPASTISGTSVIISRRMRRLVVLNAQTRANGRGQRHHRGGSGVDQLAGVHQIVVGVGQHHEAFLRQDARGFQQAGIIGEQRFLVADHLQLYPVQSPASRPSRAVRMASSAV